MIFDNAKNARDVNAANMAECYLTVGQTRYHMMSAKNFKATASKKTGTVAMLGGVMEAHKATGLSGKFTMTVYKVSEMFDEIIRKYSETGEDTYFTIQTTNEDPTSATGRSTKIYRECMLDGDLDLSAFDAAGEFLEQTVSGYFHHFDSGERYTDPAWLPKENA